MRGQETKGQGGVMPYVDLRPLPQLRPRRTGRDCRCIFDCNRRRAGPSRHGVLTVDLAGGKLFLVRMGIPMAGNPAHEMRI